MASSPERYGAADGPGIQLGGAIFGTLLAVRIGCIERGVHLGTLQGGAAQ